MSRLHIIEFPFEGEDYRARYTIDHGQCDRLEQFAVMTEDGWMALEPPKQLEKAAEDAVNEWIEGYREYLRTGY